MYESLGYNDYEGDYCIVNIETKIIKYISESEFDRLKLEGEIIES